MPIVFRSLSGLARSGLVAFVITLAAPTLAQQSPALSPLTQVFAPTHLTLATDVLKASGLRQMFENTLPNVIGGLRTNVTRTRPELAKDIEDALKAVEAQIPTLHDDGVSAAARFLAARLTEPELKEINAFLSSPVGQKYVGTLPEFMEQVVPFLEIWNQEVAQKLTGLFQQEMAKRGHKL
jgi:hypothetical protein